MRTKRKLAFAIEELIAVLMLSLIIFLRCRQAALIERGGGGLGGECLVFLLPAFYYIAKIELLKHLPWKHIKEMTRYENGPDGQHAAH